MQVCGGNESAAINQNLDTSSNVCHLSDIFRLIARVTNALIDFAGVYAVALIVYHGAKMVVLANSPETAAKEKTGLTSAIWGLMLVMASFLIVNIIFVQILGANFTFPLIANPFK